MRSVAEGFWYFLIYSFLGYLLEKSFAWATGARHRRRKCLLVLPLCPVYGLGMLAVLALPEPLDRLPWLVASGAAAAAGVEYAVHWAYETLLGVRFWDYTGLPGSLRGRVCLPFTLAWGALSAAAVLTVQPPVAAFVIALPPGLTLTAMLLFTADAVCSARYLRMTGNVDGLRLAGLWERRESGA